MLSMMHVSEEVYKLHLLQELTEAVAELESRPFRAGANAVMATTRLLRALGVPADLHAPIHRAAIDLSEAHQRLRHSAALRR
jgi:hypothetical protein